MLESNDCILSMDSLFFSSPGETESFFTQIGIL
ncbi:rCG57215, isoform CRA_b [Rattus norvegicus]|uniref:RCG57215, isoform CRA_b n=1 Tax=Rattus norvegicus TaxID=10116 RepID=A6KPK4_RAT|nr:rCG57215, isoform CRA_b [Rattus norvegicus]